MSYTDCTSSAGTFDSRIKAWLSGPGGKHQMYFSFSGDGTPSGTNTIVATRIEMEFHSMIKEVGRRGGWNIHTVVNFDQVLEKLSPNLFGSRRYVYVLVYFI